MMTLNQEQIQALFRFCEKKSVRYYDLQVELVDHLAERIEEEMMADQQLSFEAALQKVYKGFGLFGFAHIVQDKERALRKQHNRRWWLAIKSYFKLPKVIVTLMLLLLFFSLGQILPAQICAYVVEALWMAGYLWQFNRFLKMQKREIKKMMLTAYHPITTFLTPLFIIDLFLTSGEHLGSSIVFAVFSTVAILIHAALDQVTRTITRQAKELYPEAFMAA